MKWINRRRWFFPLIWILLGALLVMLPEWRFDFLLIPLIMGVAGLIFFSTGRRLLNREIQELAAQMADTCDPEPMLKDCLEIAEERGGWGKRPILYTGVQTVAAEAAGRMGRYEEAERLLKSILFGYERYGLATQLQIEIHACTLMLWMGRYKDARSWLHEAEKKLDKLNIGSGTELRSLLENRSRLYRLKTEGASEELLAQFQQEELDKAEKEPLLSRVCAHMNVARCLLDLGRAPEARPHLEFVAANGNKLAVRREAEERLRELDAAGLPKEK